MFGIAAEAYSTTNHLMRNVILRSPCGEWWITCARERAEPLWVFIANARLYNRPLTKRSCSDLEETHSKSGLKNISCSLSVPCSLLQPYSTISRQYRIAGELLLVPHQPSIWRSAGCFLKKGCLIPMKALIHP